MDRRGDEKDWKNSGEEDGNRIEEEWDGRQMGREERIGEEERKMEGNDGRQDSFNHEIAVWKDWILLEYK